MLQNFNNLAEKLTTINERYKNINEITGESFNVFRILKLESAEVRMHSALIGELLKPKGSHGQGDKFLRLFIKCFIPEEYGIDAAHCEVIIEKHTGFISEDKTQGGRLDIFIADHKGKHIIIENKIYAGDQDNQLVRYNNYASDAMLLYLTLDGHLPDRKSFGNLKIDQDFKCISYSKDIINWLELCRKETVILPVIRETITQYINLIKYLTNQTLSHIMQEEISEVIRKNMQVSIMIADNLKYTQLKVLAAFKDVLMPEIVKRGLVLAYEINPDKRYNGFYAAKPEWKELRIAFQFQAYDKILYYGLAAQHDTLKMPVSSALRAEVEALPDNTIFHNIYWPYLRPMEAPFDNWHNFEVWDALVNGELLANVVSKIDDLLTKVAALKCEI